MTPPAFHSHRYILHFLLLDVNIYQDFSTCLYKTKRQHTAVKSFACFILSAAKGTSGAGAAFWADPPADWQRLPSSQQDRGHPWPLHCPFTEPKIQPRAVEEHQPPQIRNNTKPLQYKWGRSFSHPQKGVFPSPCFAAVSRGVLPTQHKRRQRDSEPLLETWPAEEPFWRDETHEVNSLDSWFPPPIWSGGSQIQQAPVLRLVCWVPSGMCSQTGSAQALSQVHTHNWASELQTSCCSEKLNEYRRQN